ncbi:MULTISPECIES: septum site-determining protein MinC [Prochlorococcus]|uniref:Probable septum site-determining protein MinC n=1 Tax=Prochlorococcus marinus (strain SARG / CCMP1375 / SS120) TaxID=167539 RepID=MINC_PROMA|nr:MULTISPECIES: septum site-determining protein MinC [Prochlorococcus]Q7VDL2.1 RecName: Full=Probable septum site-determining protein MinC [Prochlorococcus marinus subsp. marinus str. CCMP1375]AAP99410.1 Septum formation inhibitor [Prochlorococcus marinus subsp. marinus str. CCMP1375]KGG11322.1 Septum site-determining protein MinC [Prochlorococcus marinus str. LG]KGG18723.1 Septum site-determining protein MinC [Prochlorococcus marinus str. SS2]KGG22997.1 Septum site-determining protein MinC [
MSLNNLNKKENFISIQLLSENWAEELRLSIKGYQKGFIKINSGALPLTCKDINELKRICNGVGMEIISIESTNAESIVSASALGLNANLKLKDNVFTEVKSDFKDLSESKVNAALLFHKGTLRSGEVLEADEDILILGDVNPGATVLAGGNVMIWGRLLGIAHAGKYGNNQAKITALQLRPVQLRIANKIARGPKEKPELGLAEEATIQEEVIVIKPARTT